MLCPRCKTEITQDDYYCPNCRVNVKVALDEWNPSFYSWEVEEDDGYKHSEIGIAENMLQAFIEATEHSPSCHKFVKIEKLTDDKAKEILPEETYNLLLSLKDISRKPKC
jgi:hypothetical protein